MTRKKLLQRDAYHEAGHAVVAWLRGLPVRLLSLRPDAHTWTRVEYEHHETFRLEVAPPPDQREAWRAWAKSHAVATMAGPLAFMKLTGQDHTATSLTGDHMVADRWIREADLDAGECVETANHLVSTGWVLIEAVAAELAKRKELTGQQMAEIMQPVLRKLGEAWEGQGAGVTLTDDLRRKRQPI